MTDRMINLLLVKIKIVGLIFLVALVSLFSFSFTTSRKMADDIWKQLGMTKVQGTDGVRNSFLHGYLSHYYAKNARNIAVGNREAIARDLMNYTRQYINSEAFKKEYALMRKGAEPHLDVVKVKSKEDIRKEKIADIEKSIKSSEEISKQSDDMAKAMKPNIEAFKKQLADYKLPNSKMIETFYQGEIFDREDKERRYKERYDRWLKQYPADYRLLVKTRLEKFLEVSATVDFNAELKQVGKKMKFVNPVYEGKGTDWKQVYRAGKEVIVPARKFAQEWINEIQGAK